MFSKKIVIMVSLILLFFFNVLVLFISVRHTCLPENSVKDHSFGSGRLVISIIAPFQKAVTRSIRFVENIWKHYFDLVSVAKENEKLKNALARAIEKNNECKEIKLSNQRLRNFLNFKQDNHAKVLIAEVIGKDPSPLFKTIIIDKGLADGVKKCQPVVVPEGIVGQIIEASKYYSKVHLIIDRNSAVDALIQRTRARGMVKGASAGQCFFHYILRKHKICIGDVVVSSGLDGVFPKGLRIGQILATRQQNRGIFQEIIVRPFVDFEKLEEVMVVVSAIPNLEKSP
jgi:rod shape-determining protein MreC